MTGVAISEDERRLLLDYKRTTPLILVRLKAEAILLAAEGVGSDVIARVSERQPSTVNEWLKTWRESRLASIFTGHASNENGSRLTLEQKRQVSEALVNPPSDYGIPAKFWGVPALKSYLEATFDVVYESRSSYYLLLRFCGLSFKRPTAFDRRRDDEAISQRMPQIRAEIAPLLDDDDWEVFCADETILTQEAVTRKAWLRRNEKTVLKVNRERESQSYIGFLNQKTHRIDLWRMTWQNTTTVIESLQWLTKRHPGKKLAIIWDNARFHRSKALRKELEHDGTLAHIHLIAMPPYAPDHNPIEHVWGTTKAQTANIQHDDFNESRHRFESYIQTHTFDYDL